VTRSHDLVIVGAGSGNSIVDACPDLDVAIVEHGAFGGTCLNVGCIPSKMLSYTAGVAEQVHQADRYDLDATLAQVRWRDIRDRVFGRIDAVAEQSRHHRMAECPNLTVYAGDARFIGHKTLRIEYAGGTAAEISGDRIVLAAGARPLVPEPFASAGVPYETSDTIMRLDRPPARLAIVGGGYIAAEFAHVFGEAGSTITMIDMADRLIGDQDETIASTFTELARQRYDVRLGHQVDAVTGHAGNIRLRLDDGAPVEADTLLLAAGRVPNGDRLDLAKTGLELDAGGRIAVDSQQRTSVDGIYALGDVSSPIQLKHLANRQAAVVAHNLLHPGEPVESNLDALPAAIFTSPQIASVGLTEQQCRHRGLDYTTGVQRYDGTAYGWAMEDDTGFCKVLADRGTGRLLGAHVLGAQAAILIQPLVVALTFDVDAAALAERPYWIHPALTEIVQNALLQLDR
jgi:mycothione reductase